MRAAQRWRLQQQSWPSAGALYKVRTVMLLAALLHDALCYDRFTTTDTLPMTMKGSSHI
jgi:hypothetical protein